MKKILLSLFMLAGLATFAQEKVISIRLVSPDAGTKITHMSQTIFGFYIINLTDSTIKGSETIRVTYGQPEGQPGNESFRAVGGLAVLTFDSILAGDSILVSQFFPVKMEPFLDGAGSICMGAYFGAGDQPVFQNASCKQYHLYNSVSEIEKAASTVKVYPNPATDVINFSINYNKVSKVAIMDITGRLIETVDFNLNNARVDVSNYNSGVYFYQITNNNGEVVKSGKITVN
jgi:hypothetical protein